MERAKIFVLKLGLTDKDLKEICPLLPFNLELLSYLIYHPFPFHHH